MPVRPHRGAPTRAPIAPIHQGPGASSSHSVAGAPNAALLIDFDNVTLGIRSDLQSELRNLLSSDIVKGKVAVQRAYADWRRYPQYIVPLSESSIDLIFAPAYGSSKKNATDIRLAVDAIELVFTRPEIGTYILLSGDSDFSSMVLKLKEYGKYVIGVGIRESSSDLLVQNCDEYYSYNALAGLVRSADEELVRKDPWELVTEAITRMKTNGDVMRADRLKQVMQEIDPNFDEGDLGMAKFSKFCHEAAQRGLLKVTKLENGQLEVGPPSGSPATRGAAADAARSGGVASSDGASGERGDRDSGRARRGRRGRGRGRDRAGQGVGREFAEGAATTPPDGSEPVTTGGGEPAAAATANGAGDIGLGGERLARDEAFALLRQAVAELTDSDAPIPADVVRRRVHTILGRDSESLSTRFFSRILRDAHDASVLDVRKHGDSYDVSLAATAPTVAEQLGAAAAAVAGREPAAPVSKPSITGRRAVRGRAAAPPPHLLNIGVVELEEAPATPPVQDDVGVTEADTTKPAAKRGARKKAAAKRPARPKAKAKKDA